MLTTFVIGLREGLEAALIVGIIAAFLIRGGRRQALRPMWWGVIAAVAISAGAAIGLHLANRSLSFRTREIAEGALTLIAVAGITYMIVWMRRHAHELRSHLETRAGDALAAGSIGAIVAMAFIAVIREGLETAIFLLATLQGSDQPGLLGAGALLGIVVAIGIGYAIFKGGVRIDLARFFTVTGLVLVVVAAGLVAAAIHEFAEAGLITALQTPAIDLSWLIAPGTVRAGLLTAVFGFQPVPTWAEVAAWAAFLAPMAVYVLRGMRAPRPGAGARMPAMAAVIAAIALLGACAPSAEGSTRIAATLADDAIVLEPATAPVGTVTFDVTNTAAQLHEIEVFSAATGIDPFGLPVSNSVADTTGLTLVDEVEDILGGNRESLTVDLPAGTYLVVCNLPGHYAQGMAAVFTVSG